jgi:hypothetical protein
MRALVAVATKHGATEEIAHAIALSIAVAGIDAGAKIARIDPPATGPVGRRPAPQPDLTRLVG